MSINGSYTRASIVSCDFLSALPDQLALVPVLAVALLALVVMEMTDFMYV